MNRTKEFKSMASINEEDVISLNQNTFYHSLFRKILNLEDELSNTFSYVDILIIEEKYNKRLQETIELVQHVSIDLNEDEFKHYEGVKIVLNYKLNRLKNRIIYNKKEAMKVKIELEPEMIENNRCDTIEVHQVYEKANQKLLNKYSESALQKTRQRVMEIQGIQDLIGLHITSHDERIDVIQIDTQEAKKNVTGAGNFYKDNDKENRQILFIFLLSLSFILLYLHFYYK